MRSVEGIDKFPNLKTFSISRSSVSKVDLTNNPTITSFSAFYRPLSELILGDSGAAPLTLSTLFNEKAELEAYSKSLTI